MRAVVSERSEIERVSNTRSSSNFTINAEMPPFPYALREEKSLTQHEHGYVRLDRPLLACYLLCVLLFREWYTIIVSVTSQLGVGRKAQFDR